MQFIVQIGITLTLIFVYQSEDPEGGRFPSPPPPRYRLRNGETWPARRGCQDSRADKI